MIESYVGLYIWIYRVIYSQKLTIVRICFYYHSVVKMWGGILVGEVVMVNPTNKRKKKTLRIKMLIHTRVLGAWKCNYKNRVRQLKSKEHISNPHGQKESALGQVIKSIMHFKQTWKYRENKVYKLSNRTGKLENSNTYKSTEQI